MEKISRKPLDFIPNYNVTIITESREIFQAKEFQYG